MDLSKLKEPFDPALISWRVGATNKEKTSAIALAYIDARDVMERFDEVCGPENWQAEYPFKGCCRIGIRFEDGWVWKANGAGETQVEADKGQYSDALKRAAVLWGVGRYLYDVQNVWVDIVPTGRSYRIKNLNDARLEGALSKAAKGIRPSPIEAPNKPPPFTEEEMEKLLEQLNGVSSMDEFNEMRGVAKEAYPRMDKGQKSSITRQMNALKSYLENKELDQQAERQMA